MKNAIGRMKPECELGLCTVIHYKKPDTHLNNNNIYDREVYYEKEN